MANPFVHAELNTNNLPKAKAFYGELFAWKLEDMPTENGSYTLINAGERPARALGMAALRAGRRRGCRDEEGEVPRRDRDEGRHRREGHGLVQHTCRSD